MPNYLHNKSTYQIQPSHCFALLCTLHLLLWSVCPWFVRGNLPFDTVEAIAWGNQWQWGYDKHPPLAAWISAAAARLDPSHLGVYITAQLAVVVTFIAVWCLAKRILPLWLAFVSVALLEGIIYYNLITPKFNPTTLMTPVWAVSTLVLHKALYTQRIHHWLLFGVCVAAAVLTKLQAPLLFMGFLAVLCTTHRGRKSWRNPGIYLSTATAIVLLLPYLHWSIQHDFTEIHYALNSTLGHQNRIIKHPILDHINYPIRIFISQIAAASGFFLLLIPVLCQAQTDIHVRDFDKKFLLILCVSPILLTLLYSAVTGSYLYSKWCTPYFSLLGILAMCIIHPHISNGKQAASFLIGLGLLLLIVIIGRCGFLWYAPNLLKNFQADSYFPGRTIATALARQWQQRYHQACHYVAGSHYLVANLAVYMPSQPTPYFDWDTIQSAWTNDQQLQQHGALFTWWASQPQQKALPKAIAKRFPNAQFIGIQYFPKQIPTARQAPYPSALPKIAVGVAFLPPKSHTIPSSRHSNPRKNTDL